MDSTDVALKLSDSADPESPWLGLRSFTEETERYFFGRTAELQDIFERVLHKQLTVLQLDVAVRVPHREVAGVEPVAAEGVLGGRRIAVVARHHVVALHHHFA